MVKIGLFDLFIFKVRGGFYLLSPFSTFFSSFLSLLPPLHNPLSLGWSKYKVHHHEIGAFPLFGSFHAPLVESYHFPLFQTYQSWYQGTYHTLTMLHRDHLNMYQYNVTNPKISWTDKDWCFVVSLESMYQLTK